MSINPLFAILIAVFLIWEVSLLSNLKKFKKMRNQIEEIDRVRQRQFNAINRIIRDK